MTTPTASPVSDVPAQIFEAFLKALPEAQIPEEIVSRLRKTLLEEIDLSDKALKCAIAPEETLP
jgi:hypothetical protein